MHFELPGHESSTRLLRLEASDLAMASSLVGGLLAVATDESSAAAYDLVPDPLHVVLLPLADGREEASAATDPDSDCVPAQHGQVPVTFLNTNGSGYSEVTVFIGGEEIVQLERRRFISIELEPGMHTLGLLHRDLIPFRDDYEITISPAATFIEVYSALTSTRYRLNDLPPADVAEVFRRFDDFSHELAACAETQAKYEELGVRRSRREVRRCQKLRDAAGVGDTQPRD